jgi:DNA-directed RNA polymerase delta subunit
LVTRAAARQTDKGKIIKVWQKASPSAKAQERRVTPYYSMADLSYEVIKTNRKPMYYRDILKRILPKLSHLTGKTPADTLNALLHRDARFVPLGEGIFGLREWQATK